MWGGAVAIMMQIPDVSERHARSHVSRQTGRREFGRLAYVDRISRCGEHGRHRVYFDLDPFQFAAGSRA